jgi:glutamine cyclotransferase
LVRAVERGILEWQIPRVTACVLRALPHDPGTFTQGLAFHDGRLYESSGGQGTSSLRVLDPNDGSLVDCRPVKEYFAEGIAIRNDRLYQLSWKSGRAGIFLVPSLEKIGEVRYSGEGWGLASCPEGLVMSNGTSRVRIRDERFQVLREIAVRSNRVPLRKINDLEWVGGRIFANRWYRPEIYEICGTTGRVLRVWDCTELFSAAPANPEGVLNGIASDVSRGTLFVTGKHWNRIFELAIEPDMAAP